MKEIEFATTMNKFLGAKFALGDKASGWDCLNSLEHFFKSAGVDFPGEFKGWTWSNYAERWSRGEGMEVFKEFLISLGESVDINRIMPGDIIVLEKGGIISAGLYLGNGHFQAVSNPHGVVRLPIKFFYSAIISVRRLMKEKKRTPAQTQDTVNFHFF